MVSLLINRNLLTPDWAMLKDASAASVHAVTIKKHEAFCNAVINECSILSIKIHQEAPQQWHVSAHLFHTSFISQAFV